MGSETSLILSLVLGSIGFAYFIYGKRQERIVPLLAGLALCVYPYFVSNVLLMLGIGALLLAAPFFIVP